MLLGSAAEGCYVMCRAAATAARAVVRSNRQSATVESGYRQQRARENHLCNSEGCIPHAH